MTEFYPLVKTLFLKAQLILQSAFCLADAVRQKWVVREGQLKLEPTLDVQHAVSFAYGRAYRTIHNLQAYSELEHAFAGDPVFRTAPDEAGHWGTFRGVFDRLILECSRIDEDELLLDANRADDLLDTLRTKLTERSLDFQAWARVLGIEMDVPSVAFSDQLKLVRLTESEISERHSFVDPFPPFGGFIAEDFYQHHAEFQSNLTVEAPRSGDTAPLLQASSEAHQRARERFRKGLDALRLAKSGRIELGPVFLRGGISSGTIALGRGDLPRFLGREMRIEPADEERLDAAHQILVKTCMKDRILDRAIHRFLLGRRRLDEHDRVVDYVIAWETILLTSRGSAASGELAYRFAVNGASILNSVRPGRERRDVFRQMRAAYGTRSAIVHASPEKQIAKETAKGGFRGLIDLGEFLEVAFRDTVCWLARLAPASRPYAEAGGWEELLWSDGHMA